MIIIEVNDNESIDKVLKRYKRNYQSVGILKKLRDRKHFTKPSVQRRNEVMKAVYKQHKISEMEVD